MSRKNDKNFWSHTLRILLKGFYTLFYHQFAWSYDPVAWIVSGGKWIEWIYAILPYLKGKQVLELGQGPGHLQLKLSQKDYRVFGIDRSHQMISQAKKRLKTHEYSVRLTRAGAESLPFADNSFDSIVSTFPTEYIFKLETAQEIFRVLKQHGTFTALIGVSVLPHGVYNRLLTHLYQVTQQDIPSNEVITQFLQQFKYAGLNGQTVWTTTANYKLLIVICSKEGTGEN
ncbi:MAG: class I SAM-dependent methyltransferase [Anaerolineaceae bacterium]|nr:class I SAM-dependent methyltransferase [Anaerolineaceae bacterium]